MAEQHAGSAVATEEDQQDKAAGKSRRRFIILFVVAVLVAVCLLFWWHSSFYEDTDDAQIDGHIIQVSSRISGQVLKVYVDANQFVEKGQLLVEIDPRDYEVAVKQDEASLLSAIAAFEAARVTVPITNISTGATLRTAGVDVNSTQTGVDQAARQLEAAQAKVVQAAADNTKAQNDLERYTPLVAKDVISKQQYDQAVASAAAAKASLVNAQATEQAADRAVQMARDRVTQARAQLKNAETAPQQVAAQKARADQAAAQVEQARAALEQAKLNLSYTKIVAPTAGIITRKSVELNQNVGVGQNMMTLVSLDDIWITANFKETQLRHMKAGQKVEIEVDASGRTYDGKITQIGGATGSVLSLFPPENATGNYVKVVQRLPVRIDLTDPNQNKDHLLRPGLSVEPKVRVKE